MTRRHVRCAVVLTLFVATPAFAENIQWRHDYAAACREAKEKQRPIVMDFGTSDCFWCKKLDASTFRDAAIVKQLNEQFIPLKIDADRDPTLAQSMRIESFPTLVFAEPSGKVLGRHVGFVEVAQFNGQLQRALKESAASTPPSQLAAPQLAAPTAPRTVEPAAATLASGDARQALEQAQVDCRMGRYLSCLERCSYVVAAFPESGEAGQARKLAQSIQTNATVAPALAQQLADQLADLYLVQAETALGANDHARATACLERALKVAPIGQRANLARIRLDWLQFAAANRPVPPATVRAQGPDR